jgi:hypothetical protein
MGKDSIHLLVAIEKRLNFQTQRDSKIQDEIDGNSLGNRCSIRLSYGTNCGLSRLGFVYKGCVYSTLCRRSHLNVCDPFVLGYDSDQARMATSMAARTATPTAAAGSLLRGDMIGADHVAPQLDLTLEQRTRGFRAFLVLRV